MSIATLVSSRLCRSVATVASAAAVAALAAPVSAAPAPGPSPSSRLVTRGSACGDPSDATRHTGQSVAMSAAGTTLVVGAPAVLYDRGLPGRVYVCILTSAGWQVQTILRPSFAASPLSVWGSAVAISADGSTIAVGDEYLSAPGNDVESSGLVDVFRHRSSGWQLTSELSSPTPYYLGEFGRSVALSADGNRLVVGSPEQLVAHPPHTINYNKGAAWIFSARSDGQSWDAATLPLPTTEFVANFGTAVAVSADGDTAVVGAVSTGAAVQHNGHVYVYNTAGTAHALSATIKPNHDIYYYGFGETLALSADGSTIAAGAPDDASQGIEVFNREGSFWARTATFLPQGRAVGARLGQALALSADGRTLLASAPYRAADGGAAPWVGGGYRFVHDGDGWHWGGELAPATSTPDQFTGWSIAASADARYALLGAPKLGSTGGGQSYIYLQQG